MRTTTHKLKFYSDDPDDHLSEVLELLNTLCVVTAEDEKKSKSSPLATTTFIQAELVKSQAEEKKPLAAPPSKPQIFANEKNNQKKAAPIAPITHHKLTFPYACPPKLYDLENWGGIKTANPSDGFDSGAEPSTKRICIHKNR